MECEKCGVELTDENHCCSGGTCCKECSPNCKSDDCGPECQECGCGEE